MKASMFILFIIMEVVSANAQGGNFPCNYNRYGDPVVEVNDEYGERLFFRRLSELPVGQYLILSEPCRFNRERDCIDEVFMYVDDDIIDYVDKNFELWYITPSGCVSIFREFL